MFGCHVFGPKNPSATAVKIRHFQGKKSGSIPVCVEEKNEELKKRKQVRIGKRGGNSIET
jgi:hypothetical protein